MELWNGHRIRNMANADCPSGIPNMLFNYPEMHEFSHQGKQLNQRLLDDCQTIYAAHHVVDVDPPFEEWAWQVRQVMSDNSLCQPKNVNT